MEKSLKRGSSHPSILGGPGGVGAGVGGAQVGGPRQAAYGFPRLIPRLAFVGGVPHVCVATFGAVDLDDGLVVVVAGGAPGTGLVCAARRLASGVREPE